MLADRDGAVLIPVAFLDQGLGEAPEQERMEGWIMREVIEMDAVLPGLYPMNEPTGARYEAMEIFRRQLDRRTGTSPSSPRFIPCRYAWGDAHIGHGRAR